MNELEHLGVKTMVDCRQRPNHKLENAQLCEKHHIQYIFLKTGLYKNPDEAVMDKFVTMISDPKNLPIYVCDVAAKDRTQFYLAVYRIAKNKWTAEDASWKMYRSGLRHWWPWFYKFPDVLKAHEDKFRKDFDRQHERAVALGDKTDAPNGLVVSKTSDEIFAEMSGGKKQKKQVSTEKRSVSEKEPSQKDAKNEIIGPNVITEEDSSEEGSIKASL